MLAKSPGFAAVAILTLALGIGANTAIFSLIAGVMLRSVPVGNPTELVVLQWSARNSPNIHGYQSGGDCSNVLRFGARNPSGCSFSEPMFREIAQAHLFSGTAAFASAERPDLSGNAPPSVTNGQIASGDFFHTLGVKAPVARAFVPSADSPSPPPSPISNYAPLPNP